MQVREYLGEAVLPRSEIYEVPPALLASTGAEDPQQQGDGITLLARWGMQGLSLGGSPLCQRRNFSCS